MAYTVMSRIEDVLHADYYAKNPSQALGKRNQLRAASPTMDTEKFLNLRGETEELESAETPTSMTSYDFVGWNLEQGEEDVRDKKGDDLLLKDPNRKHKFANLVTNKRVSYIEKLEHAGLRSPTARD